MIKHIPVLVNKSNSEYSARLLFAPEIVKYNNTEWKVLKNLQEDVTERIEKLIRLDRTEEVTKLLFSPLCQLKNFHIQTYSKQSFNVWLPIVYWSEEKNRILYCPLLDQFRYMHNDAELSANTVTSCFDHWLRTVMKDATKEYLTSLSENYKDKHHHYIRLINIDYYEKLDCIRNNDEYFFLSPNVPKKEHVNQYNNGKSALLSIAEPIDYRPESYEEMVFVDDYVGSQSNDKLYEFYGRIYDALTDKNHRKGVLIVGPELSGRSFAIETVLSTIQRNINYSMNNILVSNKVHKKSVWKLSGSGIISGMSLVGQWEARAEAIFSYAAMEDLILYIESLLNLTESGSKNDLGSLSVADALLTYMKEKKIRVISKITPTQLTRLRERNRSFVNQFEILTMPALSVEEQLQIYISRIQNWNRNEINNRSPFEMIPYITQLVEWTNPDSAAPGSVCKWLDKIEYNSADVIQDSLLSQMGANFPLLKNEPSPNYQEIHSELSEQVIGQEEAIDALTNWTLKFQALLSDPGRPAASMLFLGPTGVGKTESAKAVARFLYKDDSHFIRYDCNELNSPYAVSHLVGSARHEGTLTNAVRVEPFSVVLFDEIEKAHPSFHDLLLQILGEGRLTDGKGRTTSFKNCFIILTSNLGASQTGRFAGFGDLYQNDRDIYFKALERFFRPEFLNRLDKIVPFNRLGNAELELIAKRFIYQISSREGFQKRKALLSISPDAFDWLVQQGHDPKYGARQTQRSLERILVEPLSAFFAQSTWTTISVVEIDCEKDKLTYSISSIEPTKKPRGVRLTSDMFNDITTKQYNVFYTALLDWSDRIRNMFESFVSSEDNILDWENMDEQTRLRFQIIEELDSLKNDLELVATISEGDQHKINGKLYFYTMMYNEWNDRLLAPKPLSSQEWELLLQSESGVYPQNVKLIDVEPEKNNRIVNALSRCSQIHQLLASGIPQMEEALIVLFSTGELSFDSDVNVQTIELIRQYSENSYSPISLIQGEYDSSQRKKTLYFHTQGLGVRQRLMKYLSGVCVIYDEYGHLSRADSVIILPFDSKTQTPDECISKYLDSKPNVWGELRYMFMNDSFYESDDSRRYYDLPPELERAISEIVR